MPQTGGAPVGYGADFGDQPGHHVVAGSPGHDGLPSAAGIGIGAYSALILSQDG